MLKQLFIVIITLGATPIKNDSFQLPTETPSSRTGSILMTPYLKKLWPRPLTGFNFGFVKNVVKTLQFVNYYIVIIVDFTKFLFNTIHHRVPFKNAFVLSVVHIKVF